MLLFSALPIQHGHSRAHVQGRCRGDDRRGLLHARGQQTSRGDNDALSRRAAERLKALHDEADRLTLEERTVLSDLRRLELERQIKAEEFRQAERDMGAVVERTGGARSTDRRASKAKSSARNRTCAPGS